MNEMTLNAPAPQRATTVVTGIKMAVFALLVLALSPLMGFWIVALVGAALFLLPVGAVILALCPRAFREAEDHLFAYSTPFGHPFHQHPAGDSTGIRPPVPRPFGRGRRSEATQAGHCYSMGVVDVNVRAWRLRSDSPLRVIR